MGCLFSISDSYVPPLLFSDSNIENSWWLLQEYNSSSWIGRLGKHAAGDHSEAPALLTVNFHALSIIISSPNLLADTVERTLHLMEPDSTPSDRKYDELIPRTISIEFDGLSAKLRDYSYPFLLVPKSVASESAVARKSWKCQGLVVIAEQIATDASKRAVLVPMDPLPYKPVNLFKTINPIKFYTSMKISIHVPPGESARLSWGANIDPAINDMARVIDSFTKPNVDPSPIIGWWDKLRLILHGKTEIVIGGEGDFRFSILGSHNPYRRKLGSSGSSQMALFRVDSRFSEGVEMVLSKGARIAVGGGDSKYSSAEINHQIRIPELITIETGLLMFSMPKAADLVDADSKHESSESSNSMDYVVAKLIGGIEECGEFIVKGNY